MTQAFLSPSSLRPLSPGRSLTPLRCSRRHRFLGFPPAERASRTNLAPALIKASSDPISESGSNEAPLPKEAETDLLKDLEPKEPKEMKWVDIPFGSIQEELDAIDEYEQLEKLAPNDPWPKFLRGAAYEYWGQPQLALAQYAKTVNAGGLRRIPQLWERRGYNAFKLGKVAAAHSYYEVASGLFYESVGNPLHIVHWFNENFKGYIPKWNGPAGVVQRGICKYCVGMPKEAKESFMAQIAKREKEVDHALLWFLASGMKVSAGGAISSIDNRIVADTLKSDFECDDRLSLFLRLYYAASRGEKNEVADAETALSEAISRDEKDDIVTNVYLALYHDAFTNNTTERDRALDTVAAIGSPPSTRDVENFLFFTAKHRLTIPEGGENPDIPERVPM